MKIYSFYLFITLSLVLPYEESIIGEYVINSKDNFSILELKNDSTFIYKDRGISIWVWYTFEGIWSYSENILILKEEFKEFETEKYLVGDYDDELLPENMEVAKRYHRYELKQGTLIGSSENFIDAGMVFSKIKKND